LSRFLLGRLGASAAVLALVVTAAFLLLEALPGGPGAVVEDPRVPPAHQLRLRAVLGLDRPLPERYARFVGAALRGDWGVSFSSQRPVARLVAEAAPNTAALALAALAIEMLVGVPLGLVAARRGGAVDRAVRALSLALWSVPSFWLGLVLVLLFALALPWLPAGGVASPGAGDWSPLARALDLLRHLALPALAIGLPAAAGTARFARAAFLDVLREPFHLAARARGLPPRTLFLRHLLLPASAPLVELAGLSIGALLSGSLVVEIVFARPGLGRLAYDALAARDYPVLLATATVAAGAVILASLFAEVAHAVLDPRARRAMRDG